MPRPVVIVGWPGWPALLTTALPILGVLVIVAANISNIAGTWTGKWGTSPVTWGIWTALGWVALAAQIRLNGVLGSILLAALIALISTAVTAGTIKIRLDVRRGRRAALPTESVSWQRWIDRVCTVGGVVALAALLVSSGQDAMRLAILTDGIAAVPTIVLGWRAPRSQPWEPFLGAAVSALCTLAVVPEWNLEQAGLAIYLLLMGMTVAGIVIGRRWWLDIAQEPVPVPVPAPTAPARPVPAAVRGPGVRVLAPNQAVAMPWPPPPAEPVTTQLPPSDLPTGLIPPPLRGRKYIPAQWVDELLGQAWQVGYSAGRATGDPRPAMAADPARSWQQANGHNGHDFINFG